MDLRGKRLVVVGLGRSGVAASRLAARRGASVLATDSTALEALSVEARSLSEVAGVELSAGPQDDATFRGADVVVVSPGVPEFPALVRAERAGALVIGEIDFATRLLDLEAIAITGSNGKSTTTTLVGEMCRAAGRNPFVGGNLGEPPSDIVPGLSAPSGPAVAPPYDLLVLEISSFQAERMPTFSPRFAALLNLAENHLDRYPSFEAYCHAKGNLFARQTESDVAVVPAGDETCLAEVRRGRGRVVTFGPVGDPAEVGPSRVGFTSTQIVDGLRGAVFERGEIRLGGRHNALNIAAALALTASVAPDPAPIRELLRSFRGLPHRIELVAEIDGVRYYDDSKGTNVGATVAALTGLDEPQVVLIAGGRDKMGAYEPLAAALGARGRALILMGEAADRIAEAVGSRVEIVRVSSMDEAVAAAKARAIPGDAVLLSPACSSFDMFRDYKDRGESFVRAVRARQA